MKKVIVFLFLLFCMHPVFAQLNQEQQSIKQVFFDFLHYYQKNEKQFYSFKLHKGTGKEDGPPYRIQWKEVDRYANFLRNNVPYVGEAYIVSEKKDFKYYDSCFKADPEEEMAVGFDFDRWGGGQEEVPFVKEKGRWVMAGNIDSMDE